MPADDPTAEMALAALRRVRAHALLDRIHRKAEERGVAGMTMEEIDAEIAAARRERRETE